MTNNVTATGGEPDDLEQALLLVRTLWCQGGVSERTVAWAMMIEAVDRLTALHGPVNTGHLLAQLIDAVHEVAVTPSQTVQ